MILSAEGHATIIGDLDDIENDFVTLVCGIYEALKEVTDDEISDEEITELLGKSMARAIIEAKEHMESEENE